jgi:hypothetical protein
MSKFPFFSQGQDISFYNYQEIHFFEEIQMAKKTHEKMLTIPSNKGNTN